MRQTFGKIVWQGSGGEFAASNRHVQAGASAKDVDVFGKTCTSFGENMYIFFEKHVHLLAGTSPRVFACGGAHVLRSHKKTSAEERRRLVCRGRRLRLKRRRRAGRRAWRCGLRGVLRAGRWCRTAFRISARCLAGRP